MVRHSAAVKRNHWHVINQEAEFARASRPLLGNPSCCAGAVETLRRAHLIADAQRVAGTMKAADNNGREHAADKDQISHIHPSNRLWIRLTLIK